MTAVDEDVRARLEAEARRWLDGDDTKAQFERAVDDLKDELMTAAASDLAAIGNRVLDIERHVINAESNIKGMNERLASVEGWLSAAKFAGSFFIVYLIGSIAWEVWQAW